MVRSVKSVFKSSWDASIAAKSANADHRSVHGLAGFAATEIPVADDTGEASPEVWCIGGEKGFVSEAFARRQETAKEFEGDDQKAGVAPKGIRLETAQPECGELAA